MNKTATVFTRVAPEVKEQAEQILEELGVPMSSAINIFLKQVILHQGFPFPLSLAPAPARIIVRSQDELTAALQEGLEDLQNGRVHALDDVRKTMEERYRL